MSDPSATDTLDERIRVRVFPEMMIQVKAVMAEYPGRWHSESHFFRAGVAHFLAFIQEEGLSNEGDFE